MWETKLKWMKTPTYGKWVCIHCGGKSTTKYIATGHDHTDYHYNLCGCSGAKANGKHEDECN